MLLRAVRAHRLTSVATLVLALVVAAGSVAVVGAARVGGTPGAVAAMLVLYGGVALAEQTSRTATARRKDIALARLRGLTGARLVTFAAAPLLAVTLVGVALGAALGVWLAGRIAADWNASYALETREVVVAVLLLLGAWVTVCVVSASQLSRPLVEALAVHPRRRTSSWVTTFLELLVVFAGVLAVYEAHRGDHGWVPGIAPALAALAVGQVVMWLLALTPRVGHRLGTALTSRRLRRDPEPGSAVRIVVAAGLLLAVTLTGTAAAAAWRDDAAHLRAGGPTVIPFKTGALRAYAAARDADPDGRWLMAATAIDDLNARDRRVFVDADRWPAVVGDFVEGTSAEGATAAMSDAGRAGGPGLLPGPDDRGRRLGSGRGRCLAEGRLPRRSRLPVPPAGADHRRRQPEPSSGRLPGRLLAPVGVRPRAWRPSTSPRSGWVTPTWSTGRSTTTAAPRCWSWSAGPPRSQKAVVTPGLGLHATVQSIDGNEAAVDVVGQVGAVPFLGRAGSLLDLSRALRGAVGSVAVAKPVVVARADTPPAVLAQVEADGGGVATSYDDVAGVLATTSEARADRLALLVAVAIALVALTHLLAWLGGQVARRRTEVAGLRTAGLPLHAVRRAYLGEAALLAGVVLVAAGVAAVAATRALLTPIHLVGGWAEGPVLSVGVRPWTLVPVLLAVALVTAVACAVVFTRFGRPARPSALREAEG